MTKADGGVEAGVADLNEVDSSLTWWCIVVDPFPVSKGMGSLHILSGDGHRRQQRSMRMKVVHLKGDHHHHHYHRDQDRDQYRPSWAL